MKKTKMMLWILIVLISFLRLEKSTSFNAINPSKKVVVPASNQNSRTTFSTEEIAGKWKLTMETFDDNSNALLDED